MDGGGRERERREIEQQRMEVGRERDIVFVFYHGVCNETTAAKYGCN